ncbi:MAG TPA: hypothetical protein VGQ08_08135 [Nitrospiraceae bacterium]|nr:hypothetical protein [Nitrospiraceae bacterium]
MIDVAAIGQDHVSNGAFVLVVGRAKDRFVVDKQSSGPLMRQFVAHGTD